MRTDEQARLLALMRADNDRAANTFTANRYWRKLNAQISERIDTEGIGDFAQQKYNRLFSTPGHLKFQRYALWMLYEHVRERDRRGLLDRFGGAELPSDVVDFGAHRVNWDMLISLDTLLSIGELDERIWTEPVVVADLGSGWGRIGYVLEVVNPQAAYVAIDLPESLLIAQTVLPPLLPQVPVHGYEASREVEAFDRRLLLDAGGIRFCGTHHLPRFAPGSIDVFVNVASFQEMTAPQVAAYLRIAGATSRHVYLQQRWTRPPSLPPNVIGGLADYPFDPAWTRRFVRPVFFSDLFFEAGFSTSGDGDA